AISAAGSVCQPSSYGTVGNDALVQVYCFDRNEALADTAFSVNYLNLQALTGKAAYLFLGNGNSQFPVLDPTFAFNSTGATNQVPRRATGRYHVVFPALGSTGGNVVLGNPNCHVVQFGLDGADEFADVWCFDPTTANPVDTLFAIAFTDGQG